MSFKDEVNFCINFIKIQDSSNESCIYSPVSLLNSLAMIYTGSDGKTADEIVNVIGKDKNNDEIINYYSNFIKRHKSDKNDGISSEEYKEAVKTLFESIDKSKLSSDNKKTDWTKVKIPTVHKVEASFKIVAANKLFFDKDLHLLDSFCDTVKQKFDGNFQKVDFKEAKDEAIMEINTFIKDATNKKIEKVLESDDILPDTGVVLVNAIYFIGKWATPFHERHKGMFYSKIPREIDLMCRTFMFINYTKGEDWECVGLPYKDNKVWMFILLPKEKDGLQNLINIMDYSMFMECTKSNVTPNRISVTMPVFEISTDYDLKIEFPKLGIHDIFVPNVCNLSKIIAGKSYFVDKALHKAVIKVDEYGTEAAAATVNIMMPCSMPKRFRADHPFMYFIVSADRQYKHNTEEIHQQNEPSEILFAGTFC